MPEIKLVPIREFEWTNDYSYMRTLTCVNHQTARYSTKNPFFRSIHVLRFPTDLPEGTGPECPCPFSDLRVVVVEGTKHDGESGASVVLRDGPGCAPDCG